MDCLSHPLVVSDCMKTPASHHIILFYVVGVISPLESLCKEFLFEIIYNVGGARVHLGNGKLHPVSLLSRLHMSDTHIGI